MGLAQPDGILGDRIALILVAMGHSKNKCS